MCNFEQNCFKFWDDVIQECFYIKAALVIWNFIKWNPRVTSEVENYAEDSEEDNKIYHFSSLNYEFLPATTECFRTTLMDVSRENITAVFIAMLANIECFL